MPQDDLGRLRALAESDPERFRALMQEVQRSALVPHNGGQADVINSTARFKVLDAGRRWGKTKIGAKVVVTEARRAQKRIVWWVAPTYRIVKRGYREVLAQIPRELLTHTPPQDSAFDAGRSVVLRFVNGSRIEFYSAERPEAMLGEGVDYVVMDEAAIIAPNTWNQVIRPTLIDRMGGALFISTPRGHNWFYDVWKRGQSDKVEDLAWASWRFPSWTNPTLPAGELEDMRAQYPALLYEQEVEADFTSEAAAVFRLPDGSVQKLVPPAGQHIYMGIDLAKSQDFTVLSASREKDRLPVYHERIQTVPWPEQKRMIGRAVRTLIKRGATGVTLIMDSTGVGDPVVDDMEERGFDVVGVKFSNQWKQQAVMLLGSDIETGNAFILSDQVDEFRAYALHHNLETGRISYSAPQGLHDDEVSAKLLEHWGHVHAGTPDVKSIEDAAMMGESPAPADVEEDDEASYDAMLDAFADEHAEDAVKTKAPARSTAELMNDPAVWGPHDPWAD